TRSYREERQSRRQCLRRSNDRDCPWSFSPPGTLTQSGAWTSFVKIVRCVKKNKNAERHVTMPLFFHVLPCDVACQSGAYEEAFQRHATSFKKKRVQNWRKALVAVAGISGWCLRENE
ncbi:Disease resistance protein L6, partial [Linum perenne]